MKLKPIIGSSDFHVHSIFSDGANTFDDIARMAGTLGLKAVAICDHSDAFMEAYGFPRLGGYRHALHRWKNTLNDVEIIRGMELDLLSETGDISPINLRRKPDFLILSAHKKVYRGEPKTVSEAYLRALDRFSADINLLGHPCATQFGAAWEDGVDIEKVVQYANDAGIALEVNGTNLVQGKTNIDKLTYLCNHATTLYANSDAHTIYEMQSSRQVALEFAAKLGRVEGTSQI